MGFVGEFQFGGLSVPGEASFARRCLGETARAKLVPGSDRGIVDAPRPYRDTQQMNLPNLRELANGHYRQSEAERGCQTYKSIRLVKGHGLFVDRVNDQHR